MLYTSMEWISEMRSADVLKVGAAVAVVGILVLLTSRAVGKQGPRRVLLVGDSLAVGLAPNLQRLASFAGDSFAAEATTGTRSDQWAPKMPSLLTKYDPTLVLISLGTNDANMSDPTQNRGYVRSIVEAVRASGARLVWILPPTLPPKLKAQPVRDMIVDTGIETYDSYLIQIPRAGDGIHPTPSGYSSWASAIWSFINS